MGLRIFNLPEYLYVALSMGSSATQGHTYLGSHTKVIGRIFNFVNSLSTSLLEISIRSLCDPQAVCLGAARDFQYFIPPSLSSYTSSHLSENASRGSAT